MTTSGPCVAQGNGSCIHACMGNISVRKLSKSFLRLVHAFKSDSVKNCVPEENCKNFWPVETLISLFPKGTASAGGR